MRVIHRSILIFIWVLVPLLMASGQVYRFKVFNSSTGAPSNVIYGLYQDRQGYMWFGTVAGACRYDGLTYHTLGVAQGLIDPSVRVIFEDSKGVFWFATQGGVSCYDGTKFTAYTTANGLISNEVYSGLCTRSGDLWFGTASGLSRFDGKTFTSFGAAQGFPKGRVWTLFEDQQGRLWAGIRGNGVVCLPVAGGAAPTWIRYGKPDGLLDENVFAFAEDAAHRIWIATSGGLSVWDGHAFRTYTTKAGLGVNMISGVLVDRHGRIWCSTFGGGLARLDGEHFTVFNHGNGLPNDYLTSIAEDHEGNIWCGTWLNGVFRLSSEAFANYLPSTGLSDGGITGVGQTADGTLWFSSINSGLSSLDLQGHIRRYTTADGLLENSLWSLGIDHAGHIWTGGYQGVSCFDGRRFENFPNSRLGVGDRITCIQEDRQGHLWFGSHTSTSRGVARYDGHEFKLFSTEEGLVQNQVSTISLDHAGNLWFCCEGGLSRYDGAVFHNLHTGNGLPGKRVRCIFEDEDGSFWIGTTDGLCRMTGTRMEKFGIAEGLPNNSIRTITRYNGAIWVGTSCGIAVFDGQRFWTYGLKDGLLSNEFFTGACLRAQDGSLWFGTNEGAVRFRPTVEIARPLPPRMYLQEIRVTGSSTLNVRANAAGVATPLQLAFDQNSVTFGFLALSFVEEESIRYSYRLQGFDRDWSAPTPERSARFTNLPPGEYTFLVKAASAHGLWSAPQAVALTIRPPFWNLWWFRLALAALVLAAGYGVFAWRIRNLNEKQRQRLERLRELQEQRLTTLRQLLDSIRLINSQLDMTTVLQNTAEESARLVGGEPGGLGLVEGGELIFKRRFLEGQWQDCHLVIPLGRGIAGQAAAEGRTFVINDPQAVALISAANQELYPVDGFMDVPIRTRSGNVLGVLEVKRKPGAPAFSEDDRQLIESLAAQAAGAIENANLYGELEEKNLMVAESLKELERLYAQEREVTHALQELNRMKTNFLMVTSHEMRTPLTVVKGYNETLLAELFGPLTDIQKRSLGVSQRMIERMVTTFQDLLEMLKINEGRALLKPTVFDAAALAAEVVEDLRPFIEKRRQHVQVQAPGPVSLTADREKVHLVLTNVLQNAIKFTHDEGVISLTLEAVPERVRLTVIDSGIGIPAGEIDRIFDQFYTNSDSSTHTSGRYEFSARGTGLGLAIAKSYTEAHGGHIRAVSQGIGCGTTIEIEFPAACQAPMEELAPDLNRQAVKEGMR
ncbi:MAG: GAF domain-containing protein [Blastocatellia bacterium]|nr:GAF domain-containing protein [Blastocatellia bacterium]